MRSPLKASPKKEAVLSYKTPSKTKARSPTKYQNEKLTSRKYFCHLENAIYMGGIDYFKKSGKGLMFMDNGACAITCYNHDMMTDHNIVFKDMSLTSILIHKDKTKSVCFRTGPYLLYLNYNAKDRIEGIGYFIHYRVKKIYKLKFGEGEDLVVKQRITDERIQRKVFLEAELQDLVEIEHRDALIMKLQLPEEIKCLNAGENYIIGFFERQNQKSHKPAGLCFKLRIKQSQTDFDVILEERGYFEDKAMHYFGEKHFENGNYYVGEFKHNQFEGKGLLLYPKEQKWTFGLYVKGDLKEVISSSVQSNQSCQSVLSKIHKEMKPFLQNKIVISPNDAILFDLVKMVDEKDPFEYESLEYTKQEEKKHKNLSIVQEDYTNKVYDEKTEKALNDLLTNQNPESGTKMMLSSKNRSPDRRSNTRSEKSQEKKEIKNEAKKMGQSIKDELSERESIFRKLDIVRSTSANRNSFPRELGDNRNVSPIRENKKIQELVSFPRVNTEPQQMFHPMIESPVHPVGMGLLEEETLLRNLEFELEKEAAAMSISPSIYERAKPKHYRYLDQDYDKMIENWEVKNSFPRRSYF